MPCCLQYSWKSLARNITLQLMAFSTLFVDVGHLWAHQLGDTATWGAVLRNVIMLSPTEYTKIILFDGAFLLGSAISVGLVRVCFVRSKINARCSTAQTGGGYGKHKSDREGHSDVDKSCIYLVRNEAKVEEHIKTIRG